MPDRMWATSRFTIAATNFVAHLGFFFLRRCSQTLAKSTSKEVVVFLLGDDLEWRRKIATNIHFPVHVLQQHRSHPSTIFWTFGQQFCDSVIITSTSSFDCLFAASSSTHGWFFGFLAKGQVYYNMEFARNLTDVHERQVTPVDFFPRRWKKLLQLDTDEVVIVH